MLLGEHRVGKGKSQRDTLRIYSLYDVLYKSLVTGAADSSAAVPYRGRKSSVKRGYLDSLAKLLRTVFQHCHENEVETEVLREIGQMKSDSHIRSPLFEDERARVLKRLEQREARLVTALGLCHIVHIRFKNIERTCSPSLYLELLKSHRHILVPDIIGRDMRSEASYIEYAAL